MWRTLGGEPVPDLVEFVRRAIANGAQTVDIGSDSLQSGRVTQIVTVVALLTPGRGGRAVYRRQVVPRIDSLRERLAREVWMSVELGLELNVVLPPPIELTIHIDANPVPTHRSSRYVQELVGMAVSQGFKAAIKPRAWAASSTADHIVKTFSKLPQRSRDVA